MFSQGPVQCSDAALLEMEIGTIWQRDERGRLTSDEDAAPYLVLGVAAESGTVATGAALPESLAHVLHEAVTSLPADSAPAQRPGVLDVCSDILRAGGFAAEVASGPSYLIPPTVRDKPAPGIIRSETADVAPLQHANPGNWQPEEWLQLLAGDLGPWAMAVEDGEVRSLCHSARLTARAAEAGTWTRPGARGRGLAAATTAAWTSMLASTGRVLFYSTSAQNTSSQRVAARLGLREIGWLWKLLPVSGPGART